MTEGLRPPQHPILGNGVALSEVVVTVALAECQVFDKRVHLFCWLAFERRGRCVMRLRVQNRPPLSSSSERCEHLSPVHASDRNEEQDSGDYQIEEGRGDDIASNASQTIPFTPAPFTRMSWPGFLR